jgi:hypothetical protein
MNQDASSERQIPRSALLTVNRVLAAIHSAVGLRPTLEAIADGVTVSTPYQYVAVTIAEEPNAAELRVIAVIGPPDLVALLLNTTCQRTALVEHLEPVRSIMCRVAFRCGQDRCAGPRSVPWMSD